MPDTKILILNYLWPLWLLATACSPGPVQEQNPAGTNTTDTVTAPVNSAYTETVSPPKPDYDTSQWIEITELLPEALIDLKYATTDNFVEEKMYECGRCFVRPAVGQALRDVQNELQKQGLRLKFFDCYRPRPIQWKLWEKVPDPRYVADPRKGSMHNRGAAVDITLVDAEGKELDMGTGFDFFGPQAYHNFTDLPPEVLNNRRLLKKTMEQHQFRPTSTEWWHYSYRPQSYPISDMLWACK